MSKTVVFVLIIGVLLYLSCKKEYSCEGCRGDNKPPVANAGSDQVITLPTDSVTFDGSASSDPDGMISEWIWTKISGPASVNITLSSDSITTADSLVAGAYLFELKVTDNGGLSASDSVQIIVKDPLQPNRPPIAKAGADTTITLPENTMSLDGNGSTDPDNNIITYAWTKISGPSSFNMTNANSAQTEVTNLVQGTYQFELKVTDAGGLFSKDTMQVVVDNTVLTACPFQQTLVGTIPVYRYGFDLAVAGDKIVVAGGWELSQVAGSVPSYRVDIYDVVSQSWSVTQLTNHGGHVATISTGSKIFFAGGSTVNGAASSMVDIYNASDNTWTTTELSEPRSALTAARAGNKVLFAGGGLSTKVDIYDLSSLSWIATHNLSQPTTSEAVSLGDKSVFGVGTNDTGVDIYDASNNSWSNFRFAQPQLRYSAATLGNKIYLAGGYSAPPAANYPFTNIVHIYDVIANAWSTTTMSKPKALLASVGIGDKIFWAGGFDSTWTDGNNDYVRTVDDIEIYDINTGSHSHHLFSQNTYVPQIGAANGHVLFTAFTPLHVYNFNSGTWTICPNLGWNPEFISKGNTIFAIGPPDGSDQKLQVWKLEF